MRIVGGWRAGFVVVALCVLMAYDYLTEWVLVAFIDPVAADFGSSALVVGFWVCIARLFRSRDEPIDPPRPWWQLTHRSPASWFLAVVVGAAFGWGLLRLATGDVIDSGASLWWILWVAFQVATGATLVFLLVNSAVRLGRASVPENPAVASSTYRR